MSLNSSKKVVLVFWILIVVIVWIILFITDIKLVELFDMLDEHPLLAVGVLLLGYTIRPFLLLPTTIMNIFSGHLLGVWLGFLFASVAVIGSSLMGYVIGRYFSKGAVVEKAIHKYPMIRSLSQQSFMVILISRLMYLPSDLINIPAGFLRVKISNLIIATVLGSSFIIFFATSFGASVTGDLKDTSFSIDVKLMLLSLTCVGISLIVSWFLRKRFVDKGLT